MDFNSFFDRFFHGNSRSTRISPFDFNPRDGQERDYEFYSDNFKNSDHYVNVFDQFEDAFNKMFASFGMLGFPKVTEDFADESNPRSMMIRDSDEPNPRRMMIKDSDEPSPRSMMIKDSDEKFSDSAKKGFEGFDLLPFKGRQEHFETPHSYSYSKFCSIRTVRLPDGTVEEHRTEINNDGEKITTVRRTIGDTSHEIITKSGKEGLKEKEEKFLNMDENELPNFEQKWNKLDDDRDPITPSFPPVFLPSTSPSYWNLLKKYFTPAEKDEIKWC